MHPRLHCTWSTISPLHTRMQAVLSALLRLGRCSMPEIARTCKLPQRQLKQALLVLLQHNFVRAYLQPEEMFVTGVRPAQFLYEPCADWVLQILRCASGRGEKMESGGLADYNS